MTVVILRGGLHGLSIQIHSRSTGSVWVGVYMMYALCNHLIKEHASFVAAFFSLCTTVGGLRKWQRLMRDVGNANHAREGERLPSEPQQQN